MSIARTIQIENGSQIQDFNIYRCDILGIEFPQNFPRYSYNGIDISEEGMDRLVEDYIHRTAKYGDYPLVLHYLLQRCTNKIKRNCYIPKDLKQEVLLKYKHKCNECGSKERLEIDHIHPVSKGGLTQLKNLQVLCKKCNIRKSNKIITPMGT